MATKDELYEEAKSLDIEGRSEMDKDELEAAVAEAKAKGAGPGGAVETAWSRGDGTPAPPQRDHGAVERSWSRGADPEDAAAVAAANEQSRLANLGSTGSTAQYDGGQAATGGAEERPVQELADEAAEIRGAAAAREAEKVEQTGATNTTPSPDQEGAVEEGVPAVKEAGTGEAEHHKGAAKGAHK